ncbi:hypothetical protein ON010_g12174 [Phytophthora cinnamomi]|nr:hypothetical protein ON010_g12174 [Phytophthora cinnamomi]
MILPVKYHQAEPDKITEWAGRGDQWATRFIYGAGRRPKAVEVVNGSNQVARITQHTVVACLVEKWHLPRGDRFGRPNAQKYREWSALIYEAEPSPEYLKLEEMVARQAELVGPPATEKPTYELPKKRFLWKKPSDQNNACAARSEFDAGMSMVNTNPPVQTGQRLSEPDFASIRMTGGGNQLVNFVTDPTLRLHDDLAQGMRLEIDISDEEEASVYFHEGTELLIYLRNQLAALPELKDLSPKADLSTANIGEPGITTAEMKSQVRIILERHHPSFLGNGNAVPTPARGVV